MNRDDIIRMAGEAGLMLGSEQLPWGVERFAALVAAAVESKWKQAVIDELVNCHIYKQSHEDSPREALHDAICWNVEVALDPKVSSSAEALIRQGAAAEREACIRDCDSVDVIGAEDCIAAIRARGQYV